MRRLPPRLSAANPRLLRVAAAAAAAGLAVAAVAAAPAFAATGAAAPGVAGPAPVATTTPPATGGGTGSGATSGNNVGPATPGTAVCTLTSATLTQISGMITTPTGILAVESRDTDKVVLFTIDPATCKATQKTYTGTSNPLEPQDLQLGTDGTIWVCDIGDTDGSRKSVAVHRVAAGGTAAETSRMTYPDGQKTAKACLIDGDNLPIIIAGTGVYKPAKLTPNITTGLPVMSKVGDFAPVAADTTATVTGATKSADGRKVVIRTAGFAYEYDVQADNNVVNALKTTPRVTQLPAEPDGEAIAYSATGAEFLTLGGKPTGATENPKLMKYVPYVPPADPGPANPDPGPPADDSGGSFLSKLTLPQLTRIVGAVGVVGLVLAIAGIVGIRRARRRRREEEEEYDDEYYDDQPRGRRGGPRQDSYDDQYGYAQNGYAQPGYGQPEYDQYGQPAGGGYAQPGYDQYGQPAGGGYAQPGYDQYGQPAGGGYAQPGYDQYGQQAGYGGYGTGYEEEFDPMNDPRRR